MGPKKPEVGLAGPAFSKQLSVLTILLAEMLKIKTKYTYYELKFEKSSYVKQLILKLLNIF